MPNLVGRPAMIDAEARLAEKAKKPGRPPTTTKDAVLALQKRTLGSAAPAILKRLVDGALDPTDPSHEQCLRLAVERIAPVQFWRNLSDADFNGTGNARPQVTIVINGATPPVDIVEHRSDDEDVIDV